MRLFLAFIFCGVLIGSIKGQVNEQVLEDTVSYIVRTIQSLESDHLRYEAYKLNYDPCDIEFKLESLDPDGNWSIYNFQLQNLDPKEMKLVYHNVSKEWFLELKLKDELKIKRSSSLKSSRASSMSLYSKNKDTLLALGKALVYVHSKCKQIRD